MKLNELFEDDRAISPVVGVALLIAITVILAAVIGGVVLGIGVGPADTPSAQLNGQIDSTTDEGVIKHDGGDPLDADTVVIRYSNTTDDLSLSEDLTASNSVNLSSGSGLDGNISSADLDSGETVTILYQDPDSDSETILAEYEIN